MGPQWLEKLHVKGYKTFADAVVDLKPCNILIGGNGQAGKSNFLSLLKMLRALASAASCSFSWKRRDEPTTCCTG